MQTAQLQAIKADIQGNPTLSALWAAGEKSQIATYYNTTADPAFYVWKSSLPFSEVLRDFVAADWQALDNLTTGQDRIWINLKELGALDMGSAAHQAAIAECWKGTAAKTAVGTRITDLGKRTTNNIEKLLATGTGSLAEPATIGFEGTIDWSTVDQAMAS